MITPKFRRWSIPLWLFVWTPFYGCGSVDGVDGDNRIGIEIDARDAGTNNEGGTLAVDVTRHCCRESGADGEMFAEPFGETTGLVTFRYLGDGGADNTYRIDHYTVDYIPLTSPDGKGGTFRPPDLQPLDRRIANTIILTRNFTEAKRSIFLIPINTKTEYLNRVIETDRPVFGLYSLKITFFGKNNRQDITIESALAISLGSYNNCPDGTHLSTSCS